VQGTNEGAGCTVNALMLFRSEAWSLSPINCDNIAPLTEKYQQHIHVFIVVAEFDSPAFKQQAQAHYEVIAL